MDRTRSKVRIQDHQIHVYCLAHRSDGESVHDLTVSLRILEKLFGLHSYQWDSSPTRLKFSPPSQMSLGIFKRTYRYKDVSSLDRSVSWIFSHSHRQHTGISPKSARTSPAHFRERLLTKDGVCFWLTVRRMDSDDVTSHHGFRIKYASLKTQ